MHDYAKSRAFKDRKIFVIGFNKTATTSIAHLCCLNGFKSQHGFVVYEWSHEEQKVKRLKQFETSLWRTEDHSIQVFADGRSIYEFKKLDKKYKNSVFILNTRPLKSWLLSRFMNRARTFGKGKPAHHNVYNKPNKRMDKTKK